MRCNILAVDELEITGMALSNILKKYGVIVESVANGDGAFDILKSRSDINILAWIVNSGDLREFEEIAKIKKMSEFSNIPVIVFSRRLDRKDIAKAVESGVSEYIAKPYNQKIILEKIFSVMDTALENDDVYVTGEDFVTFTLSEMLDREIKAAARGGYPVSIMQVRIIPKKEYGGIMDDMSSVMKLFSRIIKTKLRATDNLFSISDDCLQLLLPFADKEGVRVIQKKIVDAFDEHSMIKEKSRGYDLEVKSVSFPEDGKIKSKLLEKLDEL